MQPRIPIFVGIDVAKNPKDVIEYGGAEVQPKGPDGNRLVTRGPHALLARKLGVATVGGTDYAVWCLLYYSGDPRKIWRYLKGADLQGPFTLATAPNALKTFLRSLRADGALKASWVIAGDDPDALSALSYTEDPVDDSGDADVIA